MTRPSIELNKQLFTAICSGNLALVTELLNTGADIQALYFGMTPLTIALDANKPDIAGFLLDSMIAGGIDLASNPGNNMALHGAARHGNQDFAEKLLGAGANIQALDGFLRRTPLAVALSVNEADTARLLASYHAILDLGFDDAAMEPFYSSLPLGIRADTQNILSKFNSLSKVLKHKGGLSSKQILNLHLIEEDLIAGTINIIMDANPTLDPNSEEFNALVVEELESPRFEELADSVFQLKNGGLKIGLDFFKSVNDKLLPDMKLNGTSEIESAIGLLSILDHRFPIDKSRRIANQPRSPSAPLKLETLALASLVADIISSPEKYEEIAAAAEDLSPAESAGDAAAFGLLEMTREIGRK